MAKKKSGIASSGENIIHFGALRLSVVGAGELQITAFGLSGNAVTSNPVRDVTLVSSTDTEPTRLLNVKKQRISFEFKVEEINEWFQFNRIIIFTKLIYTQGPNI
jgi:hypothetical protein